MITETPPRTNISIITTRKRDRNSVHDTSSFASAPTHHHDETGYPLQSSSNSMNTISSCTSTLFSPSSHHQNIAGEGAATVSPFVDRVPFTTTKATSSTNTYTHNNILFTSPLLKLEPIKEEPSNTLDNNDINNDNTINLSQSSNTSSLTFGSNNNAAANSFMGDIKMDLSGSSSVGSSSRNNNNAMIGTMIVGGAVESVVGCSVGGGTSSISSGSFSNSSNSSKGVTGFHSLHAECPPPTKRARLDHGPYDDEEDCNMMMVSSSPTMKNESSAYKNQLPHYPVKKMGANCVDSFRLNNMGDKCNNDGRLRCHVCSTEASANNVSKLDESSVATSTMASTSFNITTEKKSVPKSHSLLSFFKTKSHVNQKVHHNQFTVPASSTSVQSKSLSSNNNNLSPCRYCDKATCISCTRQCEMCQHRFCTFCTKVDYESSIVERILCFECDEYARNSSNGMIWGGGGGGGDNNGGQCDMQIE